MQTPRPATTALMAATRLVVVSAVFMSAYTACNFLTSFRSDIGLGVFWWEQYIPFVECTVVPYLSIFVLLPLSFFACRDADELHIHTRRMLLALLIAIACYAAFPLEFIFDRPEPTGLCAPLFKLLWASDLPYNRAPSLHIVVLLLIWPRLTQHLSGWKRFGAHAWLASIGVSVLTTYQHNLLDVGGGIVVAAVCFAATSNVLQRVRGMTAQPVATSVVSA